MKTTTGPQCQTYFTTGHACPGCEQCAHLPLQAQPDLNDNEQYRMQMAGISTAAIGYWKEGDEIHPDYDTVALRDVAKLYAKYAELHAAAQAQPVASDDDPTTKEQYRRMFTAACEDLGLINEALGLDPDDGGADPILDAIAELKEQIAATQPAATSESVDTPEFCDLITELHSAAEEVDRTRSKAAWAALIAHIHAWHAANKPSAPAAEAASRTLDAEAVRAIRRAVRYLEENDCTGPASDLKALLDEPAAAAQPGAEPVGTVCDVGEGFAALDLTGEVKIGDAVYLAAPAAPTTKEG